MGKMKTLASHLAVAAALTGCTHVPQPTTYDQLRAVEIALKGASKSFDDDTRRWSEDVAAQIERCKHLERRDDRAACMGVFGRGAELEIEADVLGAAYDQIAVHIQEAKRAAQRLEQLLLAAKAQKEQQL